MKVISAEEIRYLDEESLWNHPTLANNEIFSLELADGVVETRGRRVIFCWYIWKMADGIDSVKICKRHQMGMGRISASVVRSMRSNMYRDIWAVCRTDPAFDKESIWENIYITHNHAYNSLICRLDRYVVGVSYHEIVELLKHKPVEEAILDIGPTQSKIDEAKDRVRNIIMESPDVPRSSIVTMARCGILDMDQLGQVLVARSYCTEIDSRIYKEPITVSFVRGIRSVYDSSIESRSASKAQMFAKDPLAICEYFNRKLQLVAQTLSGLHGGDCGSRSYLEWPLELNEISTMAGVHYTTKEDIQSGEHKLHTLTGTPKDPIGTTVYLRTPFGCIINDRSGVCEVCVGETAHAIPHGVSPGHMAAIQIGEKISQLVLKTKHVDGTSKLDKVYISEEFEDYMAVCSDGNSFRLHSGLSTMIVVMVIPSSLGGSIPDIHNVNDVNDLDVPSTTQLKEVTLYIGDKDSDYIQEITLPTSMGSRIGYLTAKFLDYVKYRNYDLDDRGNYQIPLDEWNFDDAFISLPLKHVNMIDFKDEVESMIFSIDSRKGLSSYQDTTQAIKAMSSLVRTKININASWIMLMAYVVSAVDPKSHDYRLPRGGESHTFCTLNRLMHMRSLGAMMAYQGQGKPWKKPETYVVKNRPPHPMDHFILG